MLSLDIASASWRTVAVRRRRARAILAACATVFAFALTPTSHAIPGQPGTLDASWATLSPLGAGKLISAVGSGADMARAIALQPDGKVVVAGYCHNGSDDDFCVARYSASGELDTSFGGAGTVITPIGTSNDYAYAVTVQPDGKIIVAGHCWGGASYDFCLARYSANGQLDTNFNGTGKVITPIGTGGDRAYALALQPDGKIVVAGYCRIGSTYDFCLARYSASGGLDTSFNGSGIVTTAISTGDDYARALVLQPDGKIVVAGNCWLVGPVYGLCLARYSASGALDPTFDADGTVITSIATGVDFAAAAAVALQPDGKIIVASACWVSTIRDFCLARYGANGALDTSFDGDGRAVTAIGASDDSATALALQPDGKIVAAGLCHNGSNNDFCLARYSANGALDASFNSTGKVITAIGPGGAEAAAVALQPDGKIVVAGYCSNGSNNDFCVTRYDGGPFDARNCSMDLDGDGVVLATTDALILARVSLGMTGNAVIGNISFAAHASRQSWDDIRTYLVTQCGMVIAL
ncbi:MAG: hypothetical protein JNL19_07240 [Burkholderiales bacterium]|nr:hypothetical protein [Burkholderiales bacterium]